MNLSIFLFSIMSMYSGGNPVNWTFTSEKISATEYNLVFTAEIKDGWNIYSQYLKNDDGPIRTSFTFDDEKNIQFVGKNEESGDIKKSMDEMFGMEVIKIKHKGVFTQKVKVKDVSKPITGSVEYMCCNDLQCLPPKSVPFSINLSSAQ